MRLQAPKLQRRASLNAAPRLNTASLLAMAPKQRNIRKKRTLEEEEPEAAQGADGEATQQEIEKAALEDLKLLHKMRKRTAGIHSSALAASRAGDADLDDENELMEAYVKAQGGQAVMTEEQHMERYVEQEVAKRLGRQVDELQRAPSAREREELALYEVPDELKVRRMAVERGSCPMYKCKPFGTVRARRRGKA